MLGQWPWSFHGRAARQKRATDSSTRKPMKITNQTAISTEATGRSARRGSSLQRLQWLLWIGVISFPGLVSVAAQTAYIDDAWWTYQQDCNGDGCKAGTLANNMARLNWSPNVTNCNGTLTVYEKVYYRPCGTTTWVALVTNAVHSITGCRSLDQQHVDILMGTGCSCRDYRIEVYRNGQLAPDYALSSSNDPDLSQHREQLLSEDYCLSDFFSWCVSLAGATGSEADDNTYATKESGEPDHAGNPGGHSLWFCWTAPTNKPVTFDTMGSSFDTLLVVYTGNSVSSLTLVTNNDDIAGASNRQSRVVFTPATGTTYHIAVDGFGGASGMVALNWNQTGSGLPDLIIWGPSVSATVITRTFTIGDCEVLEGCATAGTRRLLSFSTETRNIGSGDLVMGNPATNTLFTWASCHQHYHFEQFANYDLLDTNGNVVAIGHKVGFCLEDVKMWSPTANPSVKYNCNFQGIQKGWADVYAAGLPCQYIDITGVPAGDYVLRLIVNPDNLLPESNTANNTTLVPVTIPPTSCPSGSEPANDNFAAPIAVTNTPFCSSEFNNCATKETGEPNHATSAGGHSLWFSWSPSSNQTAVITTKRSDFDTVLAVYTGTAVTSLTLVATNDDIIPGSYLQSRVSFPALAGANYRIAVDGWGSAVGTVVLNLNPAGNDDFASAYLISGTSGTTNGSTSGSSKEPNEPAHASDVGGHSVWYRWTAPVSGPVSFDTTGSLFDTTLAAYTGSIVTNLTALASNDDDPERVGASTSWLGFNATAGTTYRIAIDGFAGDSGEFALNWKMGCYLQISDLTGGAVDIVLSGVDWQRYLLLGSGDLLNWTTNTPSITMSGGFHHFTNNTVLDQQFYRAVLVP
jgi:hypothetical protein